MSRLIVKAVSAESTVSASSDGSLYVSVSRATNGKPVTGLSEKNFRATVEGEDLIINAFGESLWSHPGGETTGCYSLGIAFADTTEKWTKGEHYALGLQV